MTDRAILLLEDGSIFKGCSFGAEGRAVGEVVFNTSMTGYQEILSDPSYAGQMVTMTYPLIGNTGVNSRDHESKRLWLEGFIVKEYIPFHSNWRSEGKLDTLLKRRGIVAIEGLDTRALTRRIRQRGAMRGMISTDSTDIERLLASLQEVPSLVGQDLVSKVTCEKSYVWEDPEQSEKRFDVIVYDFGVKHHILRMLSELDCRVTVVPAHTEAEAVLAMNPDGILLSNGPGDPEALPYAITQIKMLIGKVPIFGICLGHQILSLALGAKCSKMKFGHHGGNQPVMDMSTKRVQITAQNHGFAVDLSGLENDIEVSHINLNDQTVEGMRHKRLPVSSVQYHPESSPGPHDASFFFKDFIDSFSN